MSCMCSAQIAPGICAIRKSNHEEAGGLEVLVLYQKRPLQILMRLLISPLRSLLIQH